MPEKDPFNYSVITYLWVIGVASWGGIVNFHQKIMQGHARPFNFMELVGELVTSAFVGMLTFWLCEAAGLSGVLTAAMVGITGHMGSRALWQLEKWATRKFLKQDEEELV